MLHVTVVLLVLVTVAANCWVCPAVKLAVTGETVNETGGDNVTEAVAVLVVSAWLVAVTVTVVCEPIVAGAV
jgi:hypothetical protein